MWDNPALKTLYKSLQRKNYVLFLDETYDGKSRTNTPAFYIVSGALIKAEHLARTRQDIQEIVGSNYWHSTEAMQTSQGKSTAVELLKYCSEVKDTYFISHKIHINHKHLEHARRDCIKALLKECQREVSGLKAIIIEAQQKRSFDDWDRSTVRQMKQNKELPRETAFMSVSPYQEPLLWLPDLVALSYRRSLTHSDTTSHYYKQYLAKSTIILTGDEDGIFKRNTQLPLFDHGNHLDEIHNPLSYPADQGSVLEGSQHNEQEL